MSFEKPQELRLRLIRDHDRPISQEIEEALLFGVQDNKQVIEAGRRDAAGRFIFDFPVLVARNSKTGEPAFTGRFVSGPTGDKFVYLSWRSVPRDVYVNRLKARLGGIGWDLIEASRASGQIIAADLTDWQLGDKRKLVAWRLLPV
jgi:hypothetical protein